MKRTTRILSLFLAVALLCGLLPQLSLLAGAEEIHSGYCGAEDDGSNLQWSFDEQSGLLTITGSGDMRNYDSDWYDYAPWYHLPICSVNLPDTLTSIGSSAFYDCYDLTSVTIPDSVERICMYAFEDCEALTSVSIGNGVQSIDYSAFAGCRALKSVTIPSTQMSMHIDAEVFYNCTSLTSVTIPSSVTFIGPVAFGYYYNYNTGALAECVEGFTIHGCENTAAQSYAEENGFIFIPSDEALPVTGNCGAEGDNLTWSVNLDSGLLRISGTGAMADYEFTPEDVPWAPYREYITRLVLEEGVSSIGINAFADCAQLRELTLPDSLWRIGNQAFVHCKSLTKVSLPAGLTEIGNSSFDNCSSLTALTIPDQVRSIGSFAFSYSGLERVTIGSAVESVGVNAFNHCSALREFTVSPENENYCSREGVLFDKTMTVLLYYPARKQVACYTVPGSVQRIDDRAFEACETLTELTIPEGVQSIGRYAFQDCSALADVSIPNSVEYVGMHAFRDTAYFENDAYWDGGVLYSGAWALEAKRDIATASIREGTKHVAEYALGYCRQLRELRIANGVQTVGDFACYDCSALTSVSIPDSVTSIGDHAFEGCSALTSVTIPDSVTSIGDDAFAGCSALTSVTIPGGVQSIGRYAFENCGALTSVTIPSSVTSIGYRAFGYKGYSKVAGFTVYGCEGSAAQAYAQKNGFTFVSQSKPVITNQPASASVVRGKAASFTVAADGENLRYQWQYKKLGASGWTNWSGKTEATLRLNGTGTNNGCQYRCVVTNEAGSVISETATLTVISKPVITGQPDSASVVRGKAASFTVAAEGENLRYQWQYKKLGASGWINWSGKTEATLRLNGTGTNNGCQYRCVVTNEAGSVISEAATLTVISKPVITAQPDSASVVRGKAASFTVAAEGENLRYQWQYKKLGASGWTKWTGKTEATLRLNGTGTNNGCQYRCVVTNEAGSVISEAATLSVLAP